jgi:hypothetical protein
VLPEEKVAAALEELQAHVRDPLGEQRRVAGVHDRILRAGEDERRRLDQADAVERVERRSRSRLRRPGLEGLRGRLAVNENPLDDRGIGVRCEGVLDELAQRRTARHQPHRLLGHRVGARAAGCRGRQHEPVDALGCRERELLRDHPAEARPDDVRPLHLGLVEHLQCVGGEPGCRVRPRRSVARTDAAVVVEDHVERARERLEHGLPPPARVAETLHEE